MIDSEELYAFLKSCPKSLINERAGKSDRDTTQFFFFSNIAKALSQGMIPPDVSLFSALIKIARIVTDTNLLNPISSILENIAKSLENNDTAQAEKHKKDFFSGITHDDVSNLMSLHENLPYKNSHFEKVFSHFVSLIFKNHPDVEVKKAFAALIVEKGKKLLDQDKMPDGLGHYSCLISLAMATAIEENQELATVALTDFAIKRQERSILLALVHFSNLKEHALKRARDITRDPLSNNEQELWFLLGTLADKKYPETANEVMEIIKIGSSHQNPNIRQKVQFALKTVLERFPSFSDSALKIILPTIDEENNEVKEAALSNLENILDYEVYSDKERLSLHLTELIEKNVFGNSPQAEKHNEVIINCFSKFVHQNADKAQWAVEVIEKYIDKLKSMNKKDGVAQSNLQIMIHHMPENCLTKKMHNYLSNIVFDPAQIDKEHNIQDIPCNSANILFDVSKKKPAYEKALWDRVEKEITTPNALCNMVKYIHHYMYTYTSPEVCAPVKDTEKLATFLLNTLLTKDYEDKTINNLSADSLRFLTEISPSIAPYILKTIDTKSKEPGSLVDYVENSCYICDPGLMPKSTLPKQRLEVWNSYWQNNLK